MFACPATDDFFRSRIDHMIDLRNPLADLSSRMPWQLIEASLSHLFMRKAGSGVAMSDMDLFGEAAPVVTLQSNAGRPRVPLRIMIFLLYLKHAYNESDRGVVAQLSTNHIKSDQDNCHWQEQLNLCGLLASGKAWGSYHVSEPKRLLS